MGCMVRKLSEDKARAVASKAGYGCSSEVSFDDRGIVDTVLHVPAKSLRLRAGGKAKVCVTLFETEDFDSAPKPLMADGSARTFEVQATCGERSDGSDDVLQVEIPFCEIVPDLSGNRYVAVVWKPRPVWPFVVAGIVLVIAVAVAVILSNWGDPRQRSGYYDGKTTDEIQSDLDTEMDYYSMEISIASVVNMRPGQTDCELRIENIAANHCDQKVKLYPASDSSDVLFESGAIHPGGYIQRVELAHPLPIGSHEIIAEFQGYDRNPKLVSNEGEFLGHDKFGASCGARITINVLPDEAFTSSGE